MVHSNYEGPSGPNRERAAELGQRSDSNWGTAKGRELREELSLKLVLLGRRGKTYLMR